MIKQFALHNKSKIYPTFPTWEPIIKALNVQLGNHVGPLLGVSVPFITHYSNEPYLADNAFVIHIMDEPDVDGALGYHDEAPNGRAYGRVFVKPTLDNGGTLSTGSNSVSVTLSHELIEAVGDEHVQLWATNFNTGHLVAYENCDPVEADEGYEIHGIAVSNFVTDLWFDAQAKAGQQFDFLNRLKAPFSLSTGGYMTVSDGRQTSQVYADGYPQWKKDLKLKYGRQGTRKASWQTTESPLLASTRPEP